MLGGNFICRLDLQSCRDTIETAGPRLRQCDEEMDRNGPWQSKREQGTVNLHANHSIRRIGPKFYVDFYHAHTPKV